MAVDTRNKRQMVTNVINRIGLALVPDASVDSDDRSNAAFVYSMAAELRHASLSVIRLIELAAGDIIKVQARIIGGASSLETIPDSSRIRITRR